MSSETSPDPLQRLRAVTATLRAAKLERAEAIAAARKAGHSWAVIGAALGMTGQAAGRLARRRAPRQGAPRRGRRIPEEWAAEGR